MKHNEKCFKLTGKTYTSIRLGRDHIFLVSDTWMEKILL